MTNAPQRPSRFESEAIALWRAEGARVAADAEIAAFLADATAYAREEDARDYRTERMITRATAPLPTGFTGFRLFDAATGRRFASHLRTEPTHMPLSARTVAFARTNANTLSRMCGTAVATWREEPFEGFERRGSELPGILDLSVVGGLVRRADAPARSAAPVRPSSR